MIFLSEIIHLQCKEFNNKNRVPNHQVQENTATFNLQYVFFNTKPKLDRNEIGSNPKTESSVSVGE